MGGLARICKLYGGMKVNGVEYYWDFVQDKARIRSEMTQKEWMESEKIKYSK